MIYVVVSTNKRGTKNFHGGRDGLARITTKGDAENLLKSVLVSKPDAEIMKFKNMNEAGLWAVSFDARWNPPVVAPVAASPMTTAELAEKFGVDKSSVDSFMAFVVDNLKREPKLREFLKTNPEAFMKVSIENWLRVTRELYNELIEGTSDFAKKFNDDLYENLKTVSKTGL